MTVRRAPLLVGLLTVVLAAAACEPSTITAAKDQLGRGGSRTFSLIVPISQDTIKAASVLGSDTATTASGVLAKKLDPQTLSSAIGQKLQFSGLTFQQFRFSYDQMLTAAPAASNLTFTFAPHLSAPSGRPQAGPPSLSLDTVRLATSAGSGVYAASVQSGLLIARITNGTHCEALITETVLDSTGAVVLSFPGTDVLPGATVTDTVDASGAAFQGYIYLAAPSVTPAALCVPNPPDVIAINLITTPLTLGSVTLNGINEPFSKTDTIFANEPRIRAVDSVAVFSGSFALTVQNRLPIAASVHLQLDGITRAGAPLTATINLPAAPGNGTTVTATTNLDLAGTVIHPASVVVSVTGTVTAATAVISSTTAANAVVVDGGGSLVVQSLWGKLDPTKTPELTVAMEESDEITKSQVDFGDFADVVKGVHLNDASAAITIVNQAHTPLLLSNVKLGVVRLNAAGQLIRDGSGNPAYEQDSTTHLPILVRLVAHAGDTALSLPGSATTPVTLQMAPLVDRLVHLLLGNTRAAVVTAGTVVAGNGTASSITRTDSATVGLQLTVGLDLTLPDTGIVFVRTQYSDGADLKAADSASVMERLVAATAITDVVNGTPFGATVDVAIVRDSVAETVDLFAVPGHVALGPVTVAGSPVDANGQVTVPASSSQSLTLTPAELPPLLGKRFTARIRIRLRPPPGGGLRGAIRTTDQILVHSHASIEAHAGAAQ